MCIRDRALSSIGTTVQDHILYALQYISGNIGVKNGGSPVSYTHLPLAPAQDTAVESKLDSVYARDASRRQSHYDDLFKKYAPEID